MTTITAPTKANKTDAGNGSCGICRVIDVSRPPSPDSRRSPQFNTPLVMKKIVLIVVLLSVTCAYARLVRTWTHRELAEAATTIAIIEAVSTEKTTAPLPAGFPEAADNYQAELGSGCKS